MLGGSRRECSVDYAANARRITPRGASRIGTTPIGGGGSRHFPIPAAMLPTWLAGSQPTAGAPAFPGRCANPVGRVTHAQRVTASIGGATLGARKATTPESTDPDWLRACREPETGARRPRSQRGSCARRRRIADPERERPGPSPSTGGREVHGRTDKCSLNVDKWVARQRQRGTFGSQPHRSSVRPGPDCHGPHHHHHPSLSSFVLAEMPP